MSKVCVFDHPLIQHKLSILRDKGTSVKEFRELVSEIAMLMCFTPTSFRKVMAAEAEPPVASIGSTTITSRSSISGGILK